MFFLDGWQRIILQILPFFFSSLEVLLANVFAVAPSCILETGLPVILKNICVKWAFSFDETATELSMPFSLTEIRILKLTVEDYC